VAKQEVRWYKVGSHPAGGNTFFCVNGNANHHLWIGFSYTSESSVKRVELISHRRHIILRGNWSDIIVLNVHAPPEDKCD
jgi:hypothetical protein